MVLYIELKKETENKLRERAMRRFGYAKGSIKEAVEEAVEHWLASKTDLSPLPVSALKGILKDVKQTSVQLKHSAMGLFAK